METNAATAADTLSLVGDTIMMASTLLGRAGHDVELNGQCVFDDSTCNVRDLGELEDGSDEFYAAALGSALGYLEEFGYDLDALQAGNAEAIVAQFENNELNLR